MSIPNTIKKNISYFLVESRGLDMMIARILENQLRKASVSVMMVSQLETISPPEMHINIRENMQIKTNHMIS